MAEHNSRLMKAKSRLMFATLLTLASLSASATASEKTAEAFARAMIEEIGAHVVDCPAEVSDLAGGRRALCAETAVPAMEFRQRWNELAKPKRRKPLRAVSAGAWRSGETLDERAYDVDGNDLTVFKEKAGPRMVIVFDRDVPYCSEEWRKAHPPALDKTKRDLTPPVVRRKTRPDYPAEARKMRMNASVDLTVLVRKDGFVGDICIERASTRSYGFIQAAIDSVRQWKYEGGRADRSDRHYQAVVGDSLSPLRWGLVALLAIPMPSAVASEKAAATFARSMMEGIGARVVDCPADVAELPIGFLSSCAETDLPPEKFQAAWDGFAQSKSQPHEVTFLSEWLDGDFSNERHHEIDGTFLTVYRQHSGGLVAILYDRDLEPCDESWRARHPPALNLKKKELKAAGISPPVRTKAGPPPRHATDVLDIDASLRVELLAAVDKNGSVGDVCFLHLRYPSAHWPLLETRDRLKRASAARLRRYRYAPATRNGEPIEVTVPVTFDW